MCEWKKRIPLSQLETIDDKKKPSIKEQISIYMMNKKQNKIHAIKDDEISIDKNNNE